MVLVFSYVVDFVQIGKDVLVQDFGVEGLVEVFDVGVLGGFIWLDVQ